MSKLHKLSGKELVRLRANDFGFEVSRQKGSHVVLRKFSEGRKIVTVVPLHDEIRTGTLLGVLDMAKIGKDEFLKKLKR